MRKGLGLIDPQLRHGNAEKEQRDDEIFRRFRLLPAENQKREAGDEGRKNENLNVSRALQALQQLVAGTTAACFPRSQAAPDESSAF